MKIQKMIQGHPIQYSGNGNLEGLPNRLNYRTAKQIISEHLENGCGIHEILEKIEVELEQMEGQLNSGEFNISFIQAVTAIASDTIWILKSNQSRNYLEIDKGLNDLNLSYYLNKLDMKIENLQKSIVDI